MARTAPDHCRALVGMLLLGAATLLFEVLLTRILAIALFAHLAFAAIAIALLGFAVGGWLASRHEALDERLRFRRVKAALLLAAGASLASCVVLVFVPLVPEVVFQQGQEATTWATRWRAVRHDPLQLNWAAIALATSLQLIPFAGAAYAQALLLAHAPRRSGWLYAADVAGACLGAWSSLILLPLFGAENAIAVAMLLLVTAAWAVPGRVPSGTQAGGLFLMAAALGILTLRPLAIRHAAGFSEAQVLDTIWTSLARISLCDQGGHEASTDPEASMERGRLANPTLLVDNTSRTRVAHLGDRRFQRNLDLIPFSLRPHGDVLIIGAGGGQEIANAVATGSRGGRRQIDAVDVASGIPEMMWRHFGDRPDFILSHPSVRYYVADGRSFVGLSQSRWSVVQMKEVNFHSLAGQAAAAWSPSLLFTVEAFKTYLGHLSDDGLLSVVKFYASEKSLGLQHLLATLRVAADELDLKLGPRTVLVDLKYGYGWRRALLVGRQPLSDGDLARIEAHAARNGQRVARSPRRKSDDEVTEQLLAGSFERAVSAAYVREGIVLSATRDDRPFGSQHLDFRSAVLSTGQARAADPEGRIQVANFRLLSAIIMGVALATMALLALLSSRVPTACRGAARFQLAFFACLGLGFMLLEIVLIERASLLLGHPTVGLVCILTALLLALGTGSALSNRLVPENANALARVVLATAALAGVALLPAVLPVLLALVAGGVGATARSLAAGGIVVGGAIPLGLFLPSGLRAVAIQGAVPVSSCWAANGAASVLGTVAAALLVRTVGFAATARIALLIYVAACLLWLRLLSRRCRHEGAL